MKKTKKIILAAAGIACIFFGVNFISCSNEDNDENTAQT